MHGGKREGAGRPAGSKNRSTPHQNERITELAKTHCELALQVLVDVALKGKTDSARVSAANALLDRAFGRPPVHQHIEVANSAPQVIELIAKH